MREKRLFERISSKGRNPEYRSVFNSGLLMDSVIGNLQRLLNTRRGCVMIAPELGIFDLANFVSDFPDSIHFMEDSIKTIIETYEPRIMNVKVERIKEGEDERTNLFFQITGILLSEHNRLPVLFESWLNPDGKMQVKR